MSINTPSFPSSIWGGLSPNPQRSTRQDNAAPLSEDWDQIVAEVIATQIAVDAGSAGGGVSITEGTAVTATDTADLSERMVYNPTGGTFQLNAPAGPPLAARWAVKNVSASLVAITISGNGNDIEDPTSSFAVAATFTLSGDGIAVEWEYDGTQWVVI